MTDRTPSTAAGRALLRLLAPPFESMDGNAWAVYNDNEALILAIEAHAPLDVERVGRIFHDRLDQSVLGHAGPVCQPCRQNAKAFVREYAALEEPTP